MGTVGSGNPSLSIVPSSSVPTHYKKIFSSNSSSEQQEPGQQTKLSSDEIEFLRGAGKEKKHARTSSSSGKSV